MTFPRTPLAVRLVRHAHPEGDCLVWRGCVNNSGYGMMSDGDSHTRTTHRVAYELAYGPIPPGMDVCHRCDNRRCIRPEHLFLGSRSDNMRDAQAKGRTRSTFQPGHIASQGEQSGRAKLTRAQALEIRALALSGSVSQKVIAHRFGINQSTVSDLKTRAGWRCLDGPESDDAGTYAIGSRGPWQVAAGARGIGSGWAS